MLLFQGGDNRHNTFSKTASGLALSAKASLAPKHDRSVLSCGQVVSRLYVLDMHKGPQGDFSFEDVAAVACGFFVVAVCALAQQLAHLLNRLHIFLKGGALHRSIPHFVPPLKHQVSLSQNGLTNRLRFAA